MILKTKISSFFTIPNPKYHQIIRMGKTPLYVPRTVHLGTHRADPPGVAYWHAKQTGQRLSLDPVKNVSDVTLPFVKLRPQQKKALALMSNVRTALVVMPTGSGKSILMSAYSYARKETTLILVHSMDMVKQIADMYTRFFPKMTVGMWNTNYKVESDHMMITTFASFRLEPERFAKYRVLMVDEADIAMTKAIRDKVSEHPAFYKFGFTATWKTDFDEWLRPPCALERFWGYKIEPEYPDDEILEEIIVKNYDATYNDEYGIQISPSTDWVLFRQVMQEDEERRATIKAFIKDHHARGDRSLVLFDRVEDVNRAYESSPYKNKYIIYGKIKKKEREQSKADFLEKGGIMYAQYQTSSRGIDYPECNKLFMFVLMKKETTIRQAMGRALRFLPGKKAKIYDICEKSIGSQYRAREKVYKQFFPKVKITHEK